MIRRFGVSLEDNLLEKFDSFIIAQGYTNRSEAIRDLIRDALVKKEWLEGEEETAGIAVLVYDHHQYELAQKLTHMQHHAYNYVVSSLHSHMDSNNCLEAIILKGKAKDIQKIADKLISTKGVKYGQFVGATTGKGF
ncbi:MAG: nickel-responsive transcriptional regulator NikR [Spirochaetota bacterium]